MSKGPIEYIDSQLPHEGILLDKAAIDSFARSNGTVLIHWKSIRCPIGLTDPMSDIGPHQNHDNCSNGHIYVKAGLVTVHFTNNNTRNAIRDFGQTETGIVAVTLPTTYDDSDNSVFVATYDRFYFQDEAGVIESEDVVESSRIGIDRLQFPIVKVEYLIDANGIQYYQDQDFSIENGAIKWLNSKRPGYDPKLNKGTVFTARYQLQPFFYVRSLVHEVRVASKIVNGAVVTTRLPYAVTLQRELTFQNQYNDPNTPSLPSKQKAPSSGSFGAR